MDTNIIVLGDTKVGKTSIINKYLQNTLNNGDNQVDFNLIDYGGKCTDTISMSKYIHNCKIIVIVFDLNNINTFNSVDIWYKLIQNLLIHKKFIFYLVGNKNDLEHNVNYSNIEEYSKYRNMMYYSVNVNDIHKLFKSIKNMLTDNPSQPLRVCNWFF